jgi:putative FmdB family regulatory protein
MPLYQYQCTECGVRFERHQHFDETPLSVCPECEGEVRRVIGPVGIVFKGAGFYAIDSRKNKGKSED